jgi:hypothetical protein
MVRIGRKDRRALRRIGTELRREDPLLAAMLSESSDVHPGGQHPENGKARRRQDENAARRRSSHIPFIMFLAIPVRDAGRD